MSILAFEDLKALILLRALDLRGSATGLLEEGMPPSEILRRIAFENFLGKAEKLRQVQTEVNAEKEIETSERLGCHFLTVLDPNYPRLLRQIADAPLVLSAAGSLEATDDAALAIVGSRHPGFYGLDQAQKFSREIAEAGLTVVSGFALGIDQAAHQAALKVPHGRTIAVIGCGLDVDYPKESRPLFQKISERGVVLSEYPFAAPPRAEHFPKRNRIISGLSLGVLVVEAHRRSGSLITAHEAAEQGREVFAVPGPVDRLSSSGCHLLIKEGALLVETPADVLENLSASAGGLLKEACRKGLETGVLQERFQPLETDSLTDEEKKLMMALSEKPLDYEEMAGACSLRPEQLAALATGLELKKKIRKIPQGRFVLAGTR